MAKMWKLRALPVSHGIVLLVAALILIPALHWGLPSPERVAILLSGASPDSLAPALDRATRTYLGARDGADARADAAIRRGDDPAAYEPLPLPARLSTEDKLAILRRYALGSASKDERQTFVTLARMRPGRGDLDPRGSPYGGAYLYPLGVALYTLNALSILRVGSEAGDYLRHPLRAREIYIVGRLFSFLPFLGVALLLALIGLAWGRPTAGFYAMVAWCASSQPLNQALVTKPHVWTAFWVTLALYFLQRAYRSGRLREMVMSGVAMGLAAGSSIAAACALAAFPALLSLDETRRVPAARLWLAFWIGVAVLFLTNPYAVAHPAPYLATGGHYVAGAGYGYGSPSWTKLGLALRDLFVRGTAFPFGVLGLAGIGLCLARWKGPWRRLALVWLVTLAGAGFFTGETRYVVFLIPPLCMVAGITLDGIIGKMPAGWTSRARWAGILLLVPGIGLGLLTVYPAIGDGNWVGATREWISRDLTDGVTVGLLDHPEPQDFPPLPFLKLGLVGMEAGSEPSSKPGFVVVGNTVQQRRAWERNGVRSSYELSRVLGYRRSYDRLLGFRMRSEARVAAWVYRLR